VSLDDLLAMTMIAGQEINRDKETQLNGMIMIFDVEGFNKKVASYITPSFAYKTMNILLVRSALLILPCVQFTVISLFLTEIMSLEIGRISSHQFIPDSSLVYEFVQSTCTT
jgi:hypothetical protein